MPADQAGGDPLPPVLDALADELGDPDAADAPYEQVRHALAAAASDGRLPAGTRLPTVRGLAERLGLAVNTVARAYRELEADGVVRTEGRRGTFVGAAATGDAEVGEAATAYAVAARRRGLTLPQARELLERSWGPS